MSRYSSDDVAEARRLRAAGWEPGEITRLLNRRGLPVHRKTVGLWLDDEAARRDREAQRRRAARLAAEASGGALPVAVGRLTPERKWQRLLALAAIPLTVPQIIDTLALDLHERLTEDEVRYALATDRPPRRWRHEGEKRLPVAA